MIKKRIAEHFIPHVHEDTQHRAHGIGILSLFSYLQIFLLVVFGFWIIKTKAPQILGTVSFSPQEIITLTNQKRADNGLPALSENNLLDSAAGNKAANMFTENYWAHNSPSGNTPWTFISAAGYHYVYAGENLARDFGDAKSVVDAWMNSPSHRSNILDSNFKEIGVSVQDGTILGKEGVLVVQMFGSAVTPVSVPLPISSTPAAKTVVVSPSPKAATISAQAEETPKPRPTPIKPVKVPQQGVVLATRQFSIARGISLALVSFIFMLFAAEIVITIKRDNLTLRAGVLAHLGILAFLLFAIWYAVGGAIL